jgi:CBS-domain-containing membrane protein
MDIVGLGKRVQIFIDEGDNVHGRSLSQTILETLLAEGAAGATLTRGIAGFGAHSRIHTARLVDLVSPLPLVITWIDAPERVERLLPTICGLVREGLVTVEAVEIAKYSHRDLPAMRSTLSVGEVMTREVTAVNPGAPLPEVVELLVDRDFRAVPVVEPDGRLVGIITNTDLVERGGVLARLELLAVMDATARAEAVGSARAYRASEVMTTNLVSIAPDEPAQVAAGLMVAQALKRLPVVDKRSRLVGVISRADLLRTLGEGYPAPEDPVPTEPREPRVVGDIMRHHAPVVREQARLAEVLDAVISTRLNRAVVIDHEGRVRGIISDADVLQRLDPRQRAGLLGALMHRGRVVPEAIARVTATEMMTSPALTVGPETPIPEAARSMVEARRKVLPIVDQRGVLLGIVDRADLLHASQGRRTRAS